MGNMGQSRKQRRRRKIKQEKISRSNVCQIHPPHRKLPSRPPWTSPVSRRCLEDRGRCKGGGDWSGGRGQGGVHPQVLQLCPTGDGRSHPPCRSLWILRSQKGEPVPPLPLQHLRLHHSPPPDCRHRLHQR